MTTWPQLYRSLRSLGQILRLGRGTQIHLGAQARWRLACGAARIQPQHQHIHISLYHQCCFLGATRGKIQGQNRHMKSVSPGEVAPLQSACLILICFALAQLEGGASGKAAPRISAEKHNTTQTAGVCVCVSVSVYVCVCLHMWGGLLCSLSCCQPPSVFFLLLFSSPLLSDS